MEEAFIYSNHSKTHESSVATSNPNKNGFSSPLSWRAQAYKNGNGRGRRYKEEERVVPTSPSRPPSTPRRVARAPKCPRYVSPRENRRKKVNLPHQRKLAPVEKVSPPGAREQTMAKRPATALRCLGPARR